MRVHTYKQLPGMVPEQVKRIKYKIWDYGDICTIAYSSQHVESYRFVERRQEDGEWVEVLEKMPFGWCPSSDVAICSTVDVGLTKDPNVFIYGSYLLTVSETIAPKPPANLFEKMAVSAPRNPTHTKQFKRKPLAQPAAMLTSIPLVMPSVVAASTQSQQQQQKKIKPRIPMMSIPLSAAIE
jgi:hypothetical protein